MRASIVRCLVLSILLGQHLSADAHPLKLSLSEIEYSSDQRLLTISLRLFLTDVNEALVFDPESTLLAFCEPNEAPNAESMLLDYLNDFFYVLVNEEKVALTIKSKKLGGEGINTALEVVFEQQLNPPVTSMTIKNAVFTDLFFDQSNIVYVHVNDDSRSLMLSKETPVHQLTF
ncbi:MAG: DUF6702 family protein [Pseudomonadota bacterium]